MGFPDDLYYTKEHEWARVDDDIATIGITDYAQEHLGEIVYVELPDEGDDIAKDDTFGVVESVKSVSDLYSPVSGSVQDVNETLKDNPELINSDCYADAWLIRIKMSDSGELDGLMNAEEYEEFIKDEEDEDL